eukprot:TRINITY_DN92722_c0_g1_i1.p2 TRINITY_DN92722_c0_g1~~TRINITY_DN92722_c0_g1_i1.p2  ORF type:complete len:242 (-),score=41.93 TRINITY_DN92722_c0_g1_i1:453-1178(-)
MASIGVFSAAICGTSTVVLPPASAVPGACCRRVTPTLRKSAEVHSHRRSIAVAIAVLCWQRPQTAHAKFKKCKGLEECQALGDEKFAQKELMKGTLVDMGRGIRYREAKVGTGPTISKGDVVDITYEVRNTGGMYMYSLGRGRPDKTYDDLGETYRVRLGNHDVPIAVELAMEGMRRGGIRSIEMPPSLGFETSNWQPKPTNFAGERRMENFRASINGRSSQPGYDAAMILEAEVVRIVNP